MIPYVKELFKSNVFDIILELMGVTIQQKMLEGWQASKTHPAA